MKEVYSGPPIFRKVKRTHLLVRILQIVAVFGGAIAVALCTRN